MSPAARGTPGAARRAPAWLRPVLRRNHGVGRRARGPRGRPRRSDNSVSLRSYRDIFVAPSSRAPPPRRAAPRPAPPGPAAAPRRPSAATEHFCRDCAFMRHFCRLRAGASATRSRPREPWPRQLDAGNALTSGRLPWGAPGACRALSLRRSRARGGLFFECCPDHEPWRSSPEVSTTHPRTWPFRRWARSCCQAARSSPPAPS